MAEPIAVKVSAQAEDAVGSRLALVIRERVQGSPLYRLSDDEHDWLLEICLSTRDPDDEGDRAIAGVTYLLRDAHGLLHRWLGGGLLIVGANRVSNVAEGILADLTENIGEFRRRGGELT